MNFPSLSNESWSSKYLLRSLLNFFVLFRRIFFKIHIVHWKYDSHTNHWYLPLYRVTLTSHNTGHVEALRTQVLFIWDPYSQVDTTRGESRTQKKKHSFTNLACQASCCLLSHNDQWKTSTSVVLLYHLICCLLTLSFFFNY